MMNAFAGYQIVRKLGEGGMGVVYEAVRPEGTRVALKLLAPALANDRKLLERFLREAEIFKSVHHRNVARFFDILHVDLKYYLAMEYVEGPSLDEWLRGQGALPELIAIDVVLQIARELEALDRQGIVHRDVKPSNVLVAPDDTLKLVDFGLARRAEDAHLTASDAIVGTPYYVAPEVVRCEGEIDTRADLYSLGVIFYFLVAGKQLFEGDSAIAIVNKHAYEPPPEPRAANDRLSAAGNEIILKLLAKDRAARYQRPADLVLVLERHKAGLAGADAPVG